MGDGNGGQGKPVLRSYKFPLSELTNAHTCAELRGGLTYLGRLVEKQDWEGGTLSIVVQVVQPKGEEAYLEVTQRIEEEQLLLPLGERRGTFPFRIGDQVIPSVPETWPAGLVNDGLLTLGKQYEVKNVGATHVSVIDDSGVISDWDPRCFVLEVAAGELAQVGHDADLGTGEERA